MRVNDDVVLLSLLSEGGMGAVWVAEHRKLRTEVAVKLISANLASDPSARARFEREGTSASRVKSPHVVQTLDYGVTPEGHPFIVMELLVGRDLRARLLGTCGLPPDETVLITEQLAHALSQAHEQGIVHRDLKPSNVFLCESARTPVVKLLDFGIAKETRLEAGLTTTGTIGTPFYMSPEQLTGEGPIDHLCDVWAIGVLVFEMLTGERPFSGTTAGALALAIHTYALPSVRAIVPSLPEAVDTWFSRACARDRKRRFSSAAEAARGLARALGEEPTGALDVSPPPNEATSTHPNAALIGVSRTPPSARVRLLAAKARRHGARLAAAGVLMAAMSGLVIASTWAGGRAGNAALGRPDGSSVAVAARAAKTESALPDVLTSAQPVAQVEPVVAPTPALRPRRLAPSSVAPASASPAASTAPQAVSQNLAQATEPAPRATKRGIPVDRK
jgi:hypothetical protein